MVRLRVFAFVAILSAASAARADYVPDLVRDGSLLVRVDALRGNDADCAVGHGLCQTIERAITVATGTVNAIVMVEPGAYTLAATSGTGITIPADMTLIGRARYRTHIDMTATGDATVVKFSGAGAVFRELTLHLTGTGAHAFTGVEFDSVRAADARPINVVVLVEATTVGAGTVTGIRHSGTGLPLHSFMAVSNSEIHAHSDGTGAVRGVLGSGTGNLRITGSQIHAESSGAADVRGVETTAGTVETYDGNIDSVTTGGVASDIVQTAGSIVLNATSLETSTAGGKSFTTHPIVTPRTYADPNGTANGTRYMYPGTATPSLTVVSEHVFTRSVAFRLSLSCTVAPGANTVTLTLMRRTPPGAFAATALTLSMTGVTTSVESANLSADFAASDDSTLQIVADGVTAQDCLAQVKFY